MGALREGMAMGAVSWPFVIQQGETMKITGFETIPIKGRAMILKMFTDEGLVG